MDWQSNGEYLAVKVDRYTKIKKSTYNGFELFRIKKRDKPIGVCELDNNMTRLLHFLGSQRVRVGIDSKFIVLECKWRLSTLTDVEEVKLVVRMLPIWLLLYWFGHYSSLAASLTVFFVGSDLLTVLIYDRIIALIPERFLKHPKGLSPLQRVGVGPFLSILVMIATALTEIKRLNVARGQHRFLAVSVEVVLKRQFSSDSVVVVLIVVAPVIVVVLVEDVSDPRYYGLEFSELDLPDSFARNHSLFISKVRMSLVVVQMKGVGENQVVSVWMMEHGYPKSLTKKFTINPTNELYEVRGLGKSGEPLIEMIEDDAEPAHAELFLYELYSGHMNSIGITAIEDSCNEYDNGDIANVDDNRLLLGASKIEVQL
nr:protein NRT1/ PTR FAMILY 6.3-like [Tanacetum cinerariifolium]GEW45613.1 protein NRT1/ PTR FAMILY 6.3-like [Tanacetum cinerariifolium]